MGQTTHIVDEETGRYRQIVSPETLREVLDETGDDYERPDWMSDADEWDVGEDS